MHRGRAVGRRDAGLARASVAVTQRQEPWPHTLQLPARSRWVPRTRSWRRPRSQHPPAAEMLWDSSAQFCCQGTGDHRSTGAVEVQQEPKVCGCAHPKPPEPANGVGALMSQPGSAPATPADLGQPPRTVVLGVSKPGGATQPHPRAQGPLDRALPVTLEGRTSTAGCSRHPGHPVLPDSSTPSPCPTAHLCAQTFPVTSASPSAAPGVRPPTPARPSPSAALDGCRCTPELSPLPQLLRVPTLPRTPQPGQPRGPCPKKSSLPWVGWFVGTGDKGPGGGSRGAGGCRGCGGTHALTQHPTAPAWL